MKNKLLKALGSLLMIGALSFTFAACGGGDDNGKTPGGDTTPKKTHDQITHVVTGSDKTQHHNFVDGKCTMCDQTTIFMQEAVYKAKKDILDNGVANKGTLESVWYKTRAYGVEAKNKGKKDVNGKDYDDSALWIYKKAWVYLPYGYSKEDTSKKYNVMYMMHGNGLNEGYWFAQGSYAEDRSPYTGGYGTTNILDYLAMNDKCEDTIYVGMTMYQYYSGSAKTAEERDDVSTFAGQTADMANIYSGYVSEDGNDKVDFDFGYTGSSDGNDSEIWKEWKYHLMPTIVSKYNTYTDASSIADKMADETSHGLTEEDSAFFTACEAARGHVAYTGLSRGGASVSSIIGNALEYCSYFAYESSGAPGATQIANMKAKATTYPVNYLFISCGSQEGPEGSDASMLKVRNEMGWQNNEGSDVANGDKIEFIQVNGTAHNYATWITNLYNFAQAAFKAPANN